MNDERYQLIDFGNGRKLESLAGRLVDRPSPAALGVAKGDPKIWRDAESFFDSDRKQWRHKTPWPDDLAVRCGAFWMPVRPTPFGHIGLFPEQASNWKWLARPLATAPVTSDDRQDAGLNLFAYTGASSMAMLAGRMQVVHVDAAKPNVMAARAAAARNGWQERPIRYLVDDAGKFAAREVRRGRRYQTIVLDPPAYGHAGGKTWRLERDLWPLLENCLRLLDPDRFRLLITGHSREVDQAQVCRFLQQTVLFRRQSGSSALRTESGRSQLSVASGRAPVNFGRAPGNSGRALDTGFFVRVETDDDAS